MEKTRRQGRARWPKGETPALVGIVNRKKDWQLLMNEHWYRIPVRSAPDCLNDIKYLAFYQTKVFDREQWSVNFCAEVRGIRIVRRVELLPDEPHHKRAREPYFRVDVGELLPLPNSIPSRRLRRIVFIPTTLERLRTAAEINDLFCASPIEERLHRSLKRAALLAERQYFVREGAHGYLLDFALFCRDGKLDIECDGEAYHSGRDKAESDRNRDNDLTADGWRILRFSGREITSDPGGCIKRIRRTVRVIGGKRNPVRSMECRNPRGRW